MFHPKGSTLFDAKRRGLRVEIDASAAMALSTVAYGSTAPLSFRMLTADVWVPIATPARQPVFYGAVGPHDPAADKSTAHAL